MDSHWLEAAALFAALVLTRTLLKEYPPPDQSKPQATQQQYWLDYQTLINDLELTFNLQTLEYDFLKFNYDILQAIKHEITQAPIQPNIWWVKGHQDNYTAPEDLTDEAVTNYCANKICDLMHCHPDNQVDQFLKWIPYLHAGLLYQDQLVTKKQDCHVTTAATATTLQDTIIKDSKKWDPMIDTE
jgi:hypothetical protein